MAHCHDGVDLQAGGGQHVQGEVDGIGAVPGGGRFEGEPVGPGELGGGDVGEDQRTDRGQVADQSRIGHDPGGYDGA